MHRIKILLPLLRAKVVVLIGAWDEVITKVPYGASGAFGENDPYIARTTFKHLQDTKDGMPFTVVIHSKTIAMSVIAHEAVHAASYIQDAMGMYGDFNNDELTAYTVQYICEKVEDVLDLY